MYLSNIKLQTHSLKFNKQTKRIIKFIHRNGSIQSQNHAHFIDSSTLLWKQTLKLPLIQDGNLEFEIYNLLNSASNPEQSQLLLYGKLPTNQSQNSGQVFNSEKKSSKVGSLHVECKKVVPQNKSTLVEFQKVLSSIKVSLLLNGIDKGYVAINNGKKILKSEIVHGQKGEFNFYLRMGGKHLIKSSDNNEALTVEFYNAEDQPLGMTKFSFKTENNIHKQLLMSKQGKIIGDIYFQISKQKRSSQSRKGKRKVEQSLSSMTMSKIRSLSQANLIGLGQSQFLSKPRHKRMFIMHNNNDIVMASEKRFQLYQDKQSQIVSYSRLPSMKFEEQQSKKYYRGASIGNGHKTNFTEQYKSNPGVGQYKLPSIFDRY